MSIPRSDRLGNWILPLLLLLLACFPGWDPARGQEPKAMMILQGHERNVHSVAFSPDGKALASASYDGTARLWTDGHPRAILEGHTDGVHAVAFSPDGKILASGSGDTTVKRWDITKLIGPAPE